MNSTELHVEGMSCGSCVKHVNTALQPIEGVDGVTVDLASGRVTVSGDVEGDVLVLALTEAGYPARLVTEDSLEVVKKKTGCGGSSCCCG